MDPRALGSTGPLLTRDARASRCQPGLVLAPVWAATRRSGQLGCSEALHVLQQLTHFWNKGSLGSAEKGPDFTALSEVPGGQAVLSQRARTAFLPGAAVPSTAQDCVPCRLRHPEVGTKLAQGVFAQASLMPHGRPLNWTLPGSRLRTSAASFLSLGSPRKWSYQKWPERPRLEWSMRLGGRPRPGPPRKAAVVASPGVTVGPCRGSSRKPQQTRVCPSRQHAHTPQVTSWSSGASCCPSVLQAGRGSPRSSGCRPGSLVISASGKTDRTPPW